MTTVTLKMPDDLAARVAAATGRNRGGRSAWMRRAVEAYLESGNRVRPGSCLDPAGDVIGRVEGPADLSSNRFAFAFGSMEEDSFSIAVLRAAAGAAI